MTTYYTRCENRRCGKYTEALEAAGHIIALPPGWCELMLLESGPLNTPGKAHVRKTLCGDCASQIHRLLIERLSP